MTNDHGAVKSCCTPQHAAARRPPVCPPDKASGPPAPAPAEPYASETADVIHTARAGDTDKMIRIEGGLFLMGTRDADRWIADGEGPVREVGVDGFYIDETEVTNAAFAAFVEATGYRTEAERFGWSYVFFNQLSEADRTRLVPRTVREVPWWYAVEGTDWCHPRGPESEIEELLDHPVVHVTWNDAVAYCHWAGKRLPTEAERELTARGGLRQKRFCWGDELTPKGVHRCNIWQGDFPRQNSAEDGYLWTSPVTAFPPNSFGLYDMAGNVWEWCSDWFSADWHLREAEQAGSNPRGPNSGEAKSMRGGSFLCHRSYCNRYRVAARTKNTPESSTANLGFRCARDL